MNKKQLYSAPEAELLVVKFEENIMSFDETHNTEDFFNDGEENI